MNAPVNHTDPPRRTNALQAFGQDRHRRAARMLAYALTLDDPATWNQMARIFAARLSRFEIASIGYSALLALDPDDRQAVADAAILGVA